MTDELMDGLNRPSETEQPAEPKKPGRKAAVPPVDEIEQLKAQNEALTALVMEMRINLMPDSVEKKANDALMFDKKQPFKKHRSFVDGVWYEQGGRKYNGKFELVK